MGSRIGERFWGMGGEKLLGVGWRSRSSSSSSSSSSTRRRRRRRRRRSNIRVDLTRAIDWISCLVHHILLML